MSVVLAGATAKLTTKPDPLEVFGARAAARAYMWAEGEIPDLHEAVDALQAAAVRTGIVEHSARTGSGHHGQGVRRRARAARPGDLQHPTVPSRRIVVPETDTPSRRQESRRRQHRRGLDLCAARVRRHGIAERAHATALRRALVSAAQ